MVGGPPRKATSVFQKTAAWPSHSDIHCLLKQIFEKLRENKNGFFRCIKKNKNKK